MNLSFSTRGYLDADFTDNVSLATEMGFDGIELYNILDIDTLIGKGAPFHKYNISQTVRELKEKGVSISCFDTSIDILDDGAKSKAETLIRLARDAHVSYIGVSIMSDDDIRIHEIIGDLSSIAENNGVTMLLKTRGVFADTARLRSVLDYFASDALGAMWEANHTFRDHGETADSTINNLGAYIHHVHLHDSDDDGTYNIIGEGTLPVGKIIAALSSIDYDGFISLVWKPEWMPELQDREVIFPHFVNYMRGLISPRGKKKALYDNYNHTGNFIWKKDTLISETFSEVLDKMVEEFPDQYAFKYTTLNYTRTYAEFRDDVNRFARALVSMGVKRGSKVAVWATNVPEWYITFWATVKLGAILVTVNTAYKIHEAEYLFRQSDTHTLVMIDKCLDSNYKQIITELCPEIENTVVGTPLRCKKLPFLRNIITVGFRMKGCLSFDDALARFRSVSLERVQNMAAEVRPYDVCNIQYTSGTTGFPKGVMLTHYNIINDGKCIGDRMDLSTADRMMIQVPMFHCFGMVLAMTSSMTHGATLCPMPYFSAKLSLACINQEHITCFHGVPTMFIAMFNHPDYHKTDFSYMRTGIMAGSGCPPELMRRAAKPDEMNMTGIVSVYGQTESAPGSTMSAWDDPLDLRCDTVGYAFPYIECKIIDPDTGETLPDDTDGEFCSRGYNTMKGYYKMPEATLQAVDSDGWLHSGDLARRDKDGNYRITGRLKDMIIRGGENIYPKEIEEFIYTHPAVSDVQVIGVPDEKYGEEAMACIILKEGYNCTVEEMSEFIKQRIARHKVPKYIEFVTGFPMNAAGKIQKYKMREEAVKRLNLTVK